MRCFISGPMSGRHQNNIPTFDAVALKMRAMGHEAVNPADIARHYKLDNQKIVVGHPQRAFVILACLKALATCDAIYLLPGWQNSEGAVVELAMARYLGLRVFDHLSQLKGKAA